MSEPFSVKLESWLKSSGPKTYGGVQTIFKEKGFAVIFILLMFTAALPLPTGGVTHVFEIITMLLALEMIAGRQNIWLPKKWGDRPINPILRDKLLPKMVSFIRWFERYSKPRLADIMNSNIFLRLVGLVVFVLALGSLVALPFSGLDTLPALGVVVISLSLILEDFYIFILGLTLGAFGVFIELALGKAALDFIKHDRII